MVEEHLEINMLDLALICLGCTSRNNRCTFIVWGPLSTVLRERPRGLKFVSSVEHEGGQTTKCMALGRHFCSRNRVFHSRSMFSEWKRVQEYVIFFQGACCNLRGTRRSMSESGLLGSSTEVGEIVVSSECELQRRWRGLVGGEGTVAVGHHLPH